MWCKTNLFVDVFPVCFHLLKKLLKDLIDNLHVFYSWLLIFLQQLEDSKQKLLEVVLGEAMLHNVTTMTLLTMQLQGIYSPSQCI